ncbi:tautomerase family protein [Streptomyces sp. NPDC089424]|uniref:tautomerase family protein n=1 Tax=Streptomyces sp. NPDC089424 TaxID=3365917 RepID=UPI0038027933
MPLYSCTTAQGTLTAEARAALAAEITRIHSAINRVPSSYVNVVFLELPKDSVFVGSAPGAARIADVDPSHVLVVIQDSPARSAVEDGRLLPEPGEEQEWLQQRHD